MSAPTHPAYTLLRTETLPVQQAEGTLYRHRSGARVLSLHGRDDNKVFGITFRTPPTDHTGLPHILEHSVLCGSERYPVKELFKDLMKSSLQTFLNAFTYPDRTCYPVASRNLKDFHHLIDVYLDAVFFPRLTPAVLGQEGWRLQWRQDGALEAQGVVLNEMKGVYAEADSRWEDLVQRTLFRDTPYFFDYGGHPAHIPQLTFDQFLAFHRAHYHPANAFVYFYGDDDPAERLDRLDHVLSRVPPSSEPAPIAPLPGWDRTLHAEGTYPAGEHGDEGIFASLNWLLPFTCLDQEEMLMANMTGHLLYRNPASPLRLTLLESGLGEDLLGGGVSGHLLQPTVSFGLRGVDPGKEREVIDLVQRGLERVVHDGFRPDLVEGAFNTTEFFFREQNTGGTPRGLVTMLQALNVWTHGGDPLEALQLEQRLRELHGEWLQNPACFTDWIQRRLLDNPSRAEVVVRPDPQLASVERAAEAAWLGEQATRFARDPDAKTQTQELAAQVDAFQTTPDSPEAQAAMPKLHLEDVREFPESPPLHQIPLDDASLLITPLDSSGVLYLNLILDFRDLPLDDLPLLSLYGRCLTELGTAHLDHIAFNEQVSRHTGGIHAQLETTDTYHPGDTLGVFLLRAKCLRHKIPDTLSLLTDMLAQPRLGPPDRITQLVLEEKSNEESSVIHNGSRLVSLRLAAAYSGAERAGEAMEGLSYLEALRSMEHLPPETLRDHLHQLHHRLLRRGGLRIHLGGDQECIDIARDQIQPLLDAIPPGSTNSPADWTPLTHLHREGLVLPSPVNFVGCATRLALPHPPPHGHAAVATRLLRNDYLWDRIRVQGGAYGTSCSYDRITGVCSFSSYRDPRLLETLEVYRGAADWLRTLDLRPDELEQTKIGALGSLGRSRHPEGTAYVTLLRHLIGYTENMRRTQWEQVRNTDLSQLRSFGDALAEGFAREQRLCILGSRTRLADHSLDLRDVMA